MVRSRVCKTFHNEQLLLVHTKKVVLVALQTFMATGGSNVFCLSQRGSLGNRYISEHLSRQKVVFPEYKLKQLNQHLLGNSRTYTISTPEILCIFCCTHFHWLSTSRLDCKHFRAFCSREPAASEALQLLPCWLLFYVYTLFLCSFSAGWCVDHSFKNWHWTARKRNSDICSERAAFATAAGRHPEALSQDRLQRVAMVWLPRQERIGTSLLGVSVCCHRTTRCPGPLFLPAHQVHW